ncbi:hypothetical protein EMIT0194P_150122 [Pseudomonas serbica]
MNIQLNQLLVGKDQGFSRGVIRVTRLNSRQLFHSETSIALCRSWLASEGGLKMKGDLKGLFAGKPAPTGVFLVSHAVAICDDCRRHGDPGNSCRTRQIKR